MGLIDDLNNLDNFGTLQGPRCTVCNLLRTLPPADAEALTAVLAGDDVPYAKLSRALASNGHRIAAGTLSRHKAGECVGTKR